MPRKTSHLHGKAPDTSSVALLLIDVINDLDFPGNEYLIKTGVPMARRIAALKKRARQANIPVIYVNDNFGKWHADTRLSGRLNLRALRRRARRQACG